jgi:hypothetical protein
MVELSGTEDMMLPTVDVWRPESEDIRGALDVLVEASTSVRHLSHNHDDVDSDDVAGVPCYGAVQTLVHDDTGFARWTALLVLRTTDHCITTAFDEDENPLESVQPRVGDIVLFDLHRPHALDLPDSAMASAPDHAMSDAHVALLRQSHLFVCAHVDFDHVVAPGTLPSRTFVEQQVAALVQPALRIGPTNP